MLRFASPDHPTRNLLDALIQAQARGVEVKVILDRDRPRDPYLSTVINSAAKSYLERGGVSCRFDREQTLMHLKFVIVDKAISVIGSHNGSAGSFFHYDDISLVVDGERLAEQLTTRFDSLWKTTHAES